MSRILLCVCLRKFRQQWSDPAVAVSAGTADRPTVQRDHRVDDTRRRVQVAQCWDRCADVGSAQEQTDHELREVVSCTAVLLWQWHDHKGLLFFLHSTLSRVVWNRFFYFSLILVHLKKTLIRFRMSLVQFGYKKRGLVLILLIYYWGYSCNSWIVNLQQILQWQCMTWLWCHYVTTTTTSK